MDITTINAQKGERAALIDAQRAVAALARDEKRHMTGEELGEFEARGTELDLLERTIAANEKVLGLSAAPVAETRESSTEDEKRDAKGVDSDEYRSVWCKFVVGGTDRMTADERRALSVGTNSAGGFTVPRGFRDQIIKAQRQFGFVRNLATIIETTEGNALDIPASNGFGASAWGTEATLMAGTDAAFMLITLNAYKANHLTLVSEELLQDSGFDIEGYLVQLLGENLAVLENTAFVVGDGSAKPTGLATAATTNGFTAANATVQVTAILPASLFETYHSVSPQYRNEKSRWLMHDSSAKKIRQLVDTTGQYLWQPGLVAGQPDHLLGSAVVIDPDMPQMAAGALSLVFGDLSRYGIRVAGGIGVQRLNERYAELGQVGFRVFERLDGKLLDANGIKTFKNAAS